MIESAKAPLGRNDATIVKFLRAAGRDPSLTEDQEATISRILKAFENGDIPQNISKNIVKGLTTYKDIPSAYFFVAGEIPEQYLYERKDAIRQTLGEKQVILSCYLKESAK